MAEQFFNAKDINFPLLPVCGATIKTEGQLSMPKGDRCLHACQA